MRFRGDLTIFVFFLLGLAVPVQVTLQPLLVMMKQIGIANSLFALLPPYVAFGLPFQIFVLRGFFRLIPSELLEAARIDGASEFRVFLDDHAAAVASGARRAGDHRRARDVERVPDRPRPDQRPRIRKTVPIGLLQFQGEYSSQYTLLMAGIVISIVPVLAIFLFLQRYFITGLTAGAVKG